MIRRRIESPPESLEDPIASDQVSDGMPSGPEDQTRPKSPGKTPRSRGLMMAHLRRLAKDLQDREGWAWVDVALMYTQPVWQWHEHAPTTRRPPSPGIAEELEALYAEEGHCKRELDEMYQQAARVDEDDEAALDQWRAQIDAQELKCSQLGVLILEIESRLDVCVPVIAPWVGALLTFSTSGRLTVVRNLVRTADWPEVQRVISQARCASSKVSRARQIDKPTVSEPGEERP